jgi:hypothetical protein
MAASPHLVDMFSHPTLDVRAIKPRDAIDVWRLFRNQLGDVSPFFFMVVARHCAAIGVVAERDGEVVGFALGNPNAGDGIGEVLALGVSPDEDEADVASALRHGLLLRPAFRSVRVLEEANDRLPLAAGVLAALAAAMPAEQQLRASRSTKARRGPVLVQA